MSGTQVASPSRLTTAGIKGSAPETTNWGPLAIILLGTFLIVLDFFAVNVALPSIQRDLGASPAQLEWVIAGYGLTFAILLITGGRIGDWIGRRRTFSIGVSIFVAASIACGLAPDAPALIGARLLQGVGAALVSPNVLSIIGVLYGGPKRVRAITAYGVVMGLAAVFGQLIGGLLIQADIAGSGWRAIFLLNAPVGAVALAVARGVVPESKARNPGRLDLVGIGLATVGLTALVLPLVEGRQLGWPLWTWLCLVAAPVVFLLLGLHQDHRARRGREPLLHPTILRESQLRAGLLIQVLCWCTQAGFFLILALYLQDGRHLSALDSGLVFMVLAVAYLFVSFRAPGLTRRFGRNLIAFGLLTVAAGDVALLFAVHGSSGRVVILVPGLALVGAGQGLWITPLTTTVLGFAEAERAGVVSGCLSTMQQVGNSVGVAITGWLFFAAVVHGYNRAFSFALVGLIVILVTAAGLTRCIRTPISSK